MLLAAALFLLGHLVALFVPVPAISAAALLPAILYLAQLICRPAGLMLATGYLLATLQVTANLVDRLPGEQAGAVHSVAGRIASLPKAESGASRFVFAPLESESDGMPRRILVTWYRPIQHPRAGELWQLSLRMRRPRGGINPRGFDYERWLFRHGIGATAYVVDRIDNQRIGDASGVGAGILALRSDIADRLLAESGDRQWRGMITGIAVGDRRLVREHQWQVLRETGTAHLMAISGLHVGMTAAVASSVGIGLWMLIPWLRRRLAVRDTAMAVGLAAAGAYALLAGFSLPTRRALIMLAVIAVVAGLRRSPTSVSVLSVALIAVLIADPLAPLDPGFWLSFTAVACLVATLAGRIPEPGRLKRWWSRLWRAQFAVGVGLLPLTVTFFGLSAPAGLVANLVLIPLFGIYFVPMTLALIVSLLLEFQAGVSLMMSGLETGFAVAWPALEALIRWLPANRMPVPAWYATALAALGAAYLLAPPWRGRWLGLLMFLPMLVPPTAQPLESGDLRLVVLDVGQGLAVVIETRHELVIYDPGPRYASGGDAATRVVLPYLAAMGRAAVDRIIVSHGDSDHAGGLVALRSAYPDADLVAGGGDRRPDGARSCRAGQGWQRDGVNFTFLHPDSDAWQGNNASCVLLIETGRCRLLLSGDIQREAERRLYGRVGTVDVTLVGHHGSNTSSSERWVEELSPSLALVSAAFDNRWHFPTPAVTQRWRQSGATLVNTGTDGALTIEVDDSSGTIALRRERHASRPVWRERLHSQRQAVDPALAGTVSGPAPAAVSCRDSRHPGDL